MYILTYSQSQTLYSLSINPTITVDEGVYIRTAQLVSSIPRSTTAEVRIAPALGKVYIITYCFTIQKYVEIVAPQLVNQLYVKGEHKERHIRAACGIIDAMLTRYPHLCWKHLFLPLLRPFFSYILLFRANRNRIEEEKRQKSPAQEQEENVQFVEKILTSKPKTEEPLLTAVSTSAPTNRTPPTGDKSMFVQFLHTTFRLALTFCQSGLQRKSQ